MLDAVTVTRTHAQAAGFVPAYLIPAPLPPVAVGQHVTVSPLLDEAVRLALFPHVLGETMLTVQAPGQACGSDV